MRANFILLCLSVVVLEGYKPTSAGILNNAALDNPASHDTADLDNPLPANLDFGDPLVLMYYITKTLKQMKRLTVQHVIEATEKMREDLASMHDKPPSLESFANTIDDIVFTLQNSEYKTKDLDKQLLRSVFGCIGPAIRDSDVERIYVDSGLTFFPYWYGEFRELFLSEVVAALQKHMDSLSAAERIEKPEMSAAFQLLKQFKGEDAFEAINDFMEQYLNFKL